MGGTPCHVIPYVNGARTLCKEKLLSQSITTIRTIHSAAIQPNLEKTARRRRKRYLTPFYNNDATQEDEEENDTDQARQEILQNRPQVDTDRIARDVLNMTREEVIQRLRTLIDSPNLEQQLERVRDSIPLLSFFLTERATQDMDDIEVYIRTFIFVQHLINE